MPQRLLRWLALMLCPFMTGAALSAPLVWKVSGGTFVDGGTFSGTFILDAATSTVGVYSITVAGGNTANFPAVTYTPDNSTPHFSLFSGQSLPTLSFQLNDGSQRTLRLTTAAAIDGTATPVALNLTYETGNVECFNCGLLRDVTGGTIALQGPAPGELTWTVAGGKFADGGTFTGSVTIDWQAQTVGAFNMSVAGGNTTTFPPLVYTQANATADLSFFNGQPLPTLVIRVNDASGRSLRLTSTIPLDGYGTPAPLNVAYDSGDIECYNCGPSRTITAGSLMLGLVPVATVEAVPVPTLNSIALVALMLLVVGAAGGVKALRR